MKSLDVGRCALGLCSVAVMLAACGGSQSPVGAPTVMPQSPAVAVYSGRSGVRMLPEAHAEPSSRYKATKPLLYVSNYAPNDVTVYRANADDPAPRAEISDDINSPGGACFDSQGTLYVTNQPISGPGWVSEYPFGKTTPSKVITNGMNTPAFCAIDDKGNLWVTNIGGPNVTEYLYDTKKPHMVVTKGTVYPVGIAIDHSGNLYVSNRLSNSNVVVYAAGSKTPSRTITDGITSPVGIAVDANGVLYVTNIQEKNVEEYPPGGDHPFKTITQDLSTPAAVTVNEKGWLYVANFSNSTVVEFPPGSITPSKRQVSKGLHAPAGMAYYPPLLP